MGGGVGGGGGGGIQAYKSQSKKEREWWGVSFKSKAHISSPVEMSGRGIANLSVLYKLSLADSIGFISLNPSPKYQQIHFLRKHIFQMNILSYHSMIRMPAGSRSRTKVTNLHPMKFLLRQSRRHFGNPPQCYDWKRGSVVRVVYPPPKVPESVVSLKK